MGNGSALLGAAAAVALIFMIIIAFWQCWTCHCCLIMKRQVLYDTAICRDSGKYESLLPKSLIGIGNVMRKLWRVKGKRRPSAAGAPKCFPFPLARDPSILGLLSGTMQILCWPAPCREHHWCHFCNGNDDLLHAAVDFLFISLFLFMSALLSSVFTRWCTTSLFFLLGSFEMNARESFFFFFLWWSRIGTSCPKNRKLTTLAAESRQRNQNGSRSRREYYWNNHFRFN